MAQHNVAFVESTKQRTENEMSMVNLSLVTQGFTTLLYRYFHHRNLKENYVSELALGTLKGNHLIIGGKLMKEVWNEIRDKDIIFDRILYHQSKALHGPDIITVKCKYLYWEWYSLYQLYCIPFTLTHSFKLSNSPNQRKH